MHKKKLGLILLVYIVLSNFQYLSVNSGGNIINSQFDTSSDVSVKVSDAQYECVDAWIIIGGDKSSHEYWELVLTTLEWVYDQALALGSNDDDILMLVPEVAVTHTSREYGDSSPNNMDWAFNTWAPNKVGSNGVLGVYLHDHGGTDAMANYPYPSLTASQLDQYLDDFEAISGSDRIIVVYEACSSGTFVDELSKSDRIIIGCPPTLIQLPQLLYVPLKFWVAYNRLKITIPISIGVENSTEIASVIVRVVSEDWTPPEPRDNESMGGLDDNESTYQWELTPDGSGNFIKNITINSPVLGSKYSMSFIVKDVDGRRGQIVSTQVSINNDGIAPVDNADPTVIITNPSPNADLTGIVNITVEGEDDQALDKIQILFDGELLKEQDMPSYYPYPEVEYSLDASKYENGVHNITAVAVDEANNKKQTSILVNISKDGIPGFQITVLFTGTILGVIIIVMLHRKKNNV